MQIQYMYCPYAVQIIEDDTGLIGRPAEVSEVLTLNHFLLHASYTKHPYDECNIYSMYLGRVVVS